MVFDPATLCKVAAKLPTLVDLDAESRTRSSINRSYYALFLSVWCAIAKQQVRSVASPPKHGALTDALFMAGKQGDSKDLIAVGRILADAYKARQQADYRIEPDAAFAAKVSAPSYAGHLARTVAATVRRLPDIDFSSVEIR